MEKIAIRLAAHGYVLRSGGADGADTAFERGATNKEIFLPWKGFNQNASTFFTPSYNAFRMAEKLHPNWAGLKPPVRKLMARNAHQVIGRNLDSPVTFVLCWTPDGCERHADRTIKTGGTGLAISLADTQGIPVINMANPDYMARLTEIVEKNILSSAMTEPHVDANQIDGFIAPC